MESNIRDDAMSISDLGKKSKIEGYRSRIDKDIKLVQDYVIGYQENQSDPEQARLLNKELYVSDKQSKEIQECADRNPHDCQR